SGTLVFPTSVENLGRVQSLWCPQAPREPRTATTKMVGSTPFSFSRMEPPRAFSDFGAGSVISECVTPGCDMASTDKKAAWENGMHTLKREKFRNASVGVSATWPKERPRRKRS